jgi:hypothetical protein
MMSRHPALARALATQRSAELQKIAQPRFATRSQQRRMRAVQAARRDAGWLLVDLGLRLALPRRTRPRPVARAHR